MSSENYAENGDGLHLKLLTTSSYTKVTSLLNVTKHDDKKLVGEGEVK